MTAAIEKAIRENIKKITDTKEFKVSLAEFSTRKKEGYIVINNSFLERQSANKNKTIKSNKYLALKCSSSGVPTGDIFVLRRAAKNRQINNFSYENSEDAPDVKTLSKAVAEEQASLGEIVFSLIGSAEDNIPTEITANFEGISKIICDPSLGTKINVVGDELRFGKLDAEDQVIGALEKLYKTAGKNPPDNLHQEVFRLFDFLRRDASMSLSLPQLKADLKKSNITEKFLEALKKQRKNYNSALTEYSKKGEPEFFNEILRISYLFGSDAMDFLKLLTSLCDLKPIVLWATIAEHYEVSNAFSLLPYPTRPKKADLNTYIETVNLARNHRFHRLFPFEKSLVLKLPKDAMKDVHLTFFGEYKAETNILSYQDRELVELLIGFTRTKERHASDDFWKKNLEVIDKLINLFEVTNTHLKSLREYNLKT